MHNQLFAPSFPSISHYNTTGLSNKIYCHPIVRAILINAYYENFKSEIPLFPFLLQGGQKWNSMQEQTSGEQIFAASSAQATWGIPKSGSFYILKYLK